MTKKIRPTPSAPASLAPYSVAVEGGGLVFISGQVAIDPATGTRVEDDFVVQTRQVLDNIGAILGDLGLDYGDIVKTTVFLADINDFADFNSVYAEYFSENPPARSAIQAGALPGGFLVEVEVVADARGNE